MQIKAFFLIYLFILFFLCKFVYKFNIYKIMRNIINLSDMSVEEMLLNHANYINTLLNKQSEETEPSVEYNENLNKLLNLQNVINDPNTNLNSEIDLGNPTDNNTKEYLDNLKQQYEINNTIINPELKTEQEQEQNITQDQIPEFTKYKITSNFGIRTSPKPGASSNHRGIDIATPVNTSVKAPSNGKITKVSSDPKSGNYVIAKLDNGLEIIMAHLNGTNLKVGDTFNTGDIIANTGNTGNTTGPHLHFGVKENGKHVDPTKYINLNTMFV